MDRVTKRSMAALLAGYGVAASPGPGWQAVQCPWHDDATASASFNEGEALYKCHACGVSGPIEAVLEQIGESADALDSLPEVSTATSPAPARTLAMPMLAAAVTRYASHVELAAEWLGRRGFGRAEAEAAGLGVVADPAPGHAAYEGRLSIPYMAVKGPTNLRFRCLRDHDCRQSKCPKYLSLPGSRAGMYDSRQVARATDTIAVCEGELDAATLTYLVGIPAVGIPGASAWQPHFSRVLSGFSRVLVFGDGDEPGRKFSRSVASLVDYAVEVPMPDGHDVNSLYVAGGAAALRSRCFAQS